MAGRNVYLYVAEETLRDVGANIGSDASGFIEAVKCGPPWVAGSAEGLCQRALRTMRDWRRLSLPYPPYIAYLALFVYAAGIPGDFAPHAYYPRLRYLMDIHPLGGSTLPSFDRMLELWDDLEQWSVKDHNGEFGLFSATIAGNWIHVGLPLAQTILSSDERVALPSIFAAAGLDSTAIPTDDEMSRTLLQFGAGSLRRTNIDMLNESGDSERRQALLNAVANVLLEWDGDVPIVPGSEQKIYAGTLKIALELDLVSETTTALVRAVLPKQFDDNGTLQLQFTGSEQVAAVREDIPGWSLPLSNPLSSKTISAADFDWLYGERLAESSGAMILRMPARPVRIFVDGKQNNLPGYIETHSLPGNQSVLLLYHQSAEGAVSAWLSDGCVGVVHLARNTVRPDWNLCSITRVQSDLKIRSKYPWVRLPDAVRIQLRGGVRLSRGNKYFRFAPPNVVLIGATGEEHILINGALQTPDAASTVQLSTDTKDSRIQIEVLRHGEIVARQSLFFIDEFTENANSPYSLDKFARVTRGTTGGVEGARIDVEAISGHYQWVLPFVFWGKSHTYFLIGEKPGEISIWPTEPNPPWRVDWAVQNAVESQAIYCVSGDGRSATECRDRKRIALWKDVVWYRRKRVKAPRTRRLAAKWRALQDVARDV